MIAEPQVPPSTSDQSRPKRPRAPGSPLLPAVAATGASAGLLTLAAPPFEQAWLGWLALAPLFWALAGAAEAPGGKGILRAAGLGFLHGFLYLLFLVPWFAAFTPAGYPAAAAYWGFLSALLFGGAAWVLRRSPAPLAPAVLAAGWVVLEWLRAQGVLAFPWGTLAATQYRTLPVLQMLDLTGAYGLSFLMALASAALAFLARPASRSLALRWGAAVAALALLATARGAWILSRPVSGPMVRAGVVQASESRQTEGAAVECVSPFEEYEARTRELLRQRPELVAWPETACVADVVNSPMVRSRLFDLLGRSDAHLLTGSFVVDPPSGQTTNSAAMVSPRGRILGQYAKVLIVPFGEYLPARPLLSWTTRLGMPESDLKGGTRFAPLSWARGSVGVSICFESAFGEVSRRMVREGANLLAVLTSDGWAGRTTAGRQHAAFAPLRAVEQRRSLARAAATGVSQLLDPYGRPLRSLPMFEKGVLVADLPLRTERTLYSYLGDWPVLLAWIVLLAPPLSRLQRRVRPGRRNTATG